MNITLITPYPNPDDRHAKNTGVGSYSAYLAEALEKSGHTLTILAQDDTTGTEYTTGNIRVLRVWKKTFGGLYTLLKKIYSIHSPVIHIQHEFNMFGQEILLPFTPLIPLIARLSGARIVTTFHGGTGIACIDRIFVEENGKKIPPWIIRLAFRYIFGLFSLFSHEIIVHEEFQKRELVEEHGIDGKKISVIPHGVPDAPEILIDARKRLNLPIDKKIFLFMGFAARYKGLPELYDAYSAYIQSHPDTLLIVGAGPAPRLSEDNEYMSWYNGLQQQYEGLGENVIWIGFIDGADIASYYSAADAILFPYSRRLAASGPMAIAIGYEKDIVLSSIMKGENNYVFDFEDLKNTYDIKKERTWEKVAKGTIEIYQK